MTDHVIHLPKDGRDVPGIRFAPERKGWPTNRWFDTSVARERFGATRLVIVGHGNNVLPGGADATCEWDDPDLPTLLAGEMTIWGSSKRAVLVGSSSAGSGWRPIEWNVDGDVLLEGKPDGSDGGKWPIDGYQHTGKVRGLRVRAARYKGDGHGMYWRGSHDVEFEDVVIEDAYKEGGKFASRGNYEMWGGDESQWTKHTAQGQPWPRMPRWCFRNCTTRNFALSHKPDDPTYHFGGGWIIQPSNAFVTFEECTFDDSHDSGTMLLGMNDGTTQEGFESWAYDRPERGHPANGPFVVIRSRFIAPARAGRVPRILVQDTTEPPVFLECEYQLHPDARKVFS